jgi:hypothetical protein
MMEGIVPNKIVNLGENELCRIDRGFPPRLGFGHDEELD